MARKHRNVLLNLSSYREMQISTTARDSGHPSKQLQFLGCGQEAGQPGLCRSAGACRGHRSLEGGLTVSTGEHTRAPRPRNSSPVYTAKRRARVCPARDPCQNVPRGSVRSSPHPGASPGTSNSKMGKHAVVGGGRAAGRTSSSRASQPDTEPRSRTPALPRYNLTYTQPKTAHLLLRRRAVIGEGAARGTGGRQGSGLGAGCAQGVGCVLGTCRFPESVVKARAESTRLRTEIITKQHGTGLRVLTIFRGVTDRLWSPSKPPAFPVSGTPLMCGGAAPMACFTPHIHPECRDPLPRCRKQRLRPRRPGTAPRLTAGQWRRPGRGGPVGDGPLG